MVKHTNKRRHMKKTRVHKSRKHRTSRKMRGGVFGLNTSALKKQATKTIGQGVHTSVKSRIGNLQSKVGNAVQTGALSPKGKQLAMNVAKHAAIASSATTNMHNQMSKLSKHVSTSMPKSVNSVAAGKLQQVHNAAKKVTQQVKQQTK